MSHFDIQAISAGYHRDKRILKDISLTIPSGCFCSVLGPNGSGKSTLARVIANVLTPFTGAVALDEHSLSGISRKQLARQVSYLPQRPDAPADFSAHQLVCMGRHPYIKWGRGLTARDLEVVEWAINHTAIDHLRDRSVNTLSGGERQRVWIALALAQEAESLILDEPTTFLDVSYQFEVLELLRALNRDLNKTIITVLHDLNHAVRYSDFTVVMKDGELVASGDPHTVLTPELLQEVFGIKAETHTSLEDGEVLLVPLRSCRHSIDLTETAGLDQKPASSIPDRESDK